MPTLNESTIEKMAIELLQEVGFSYVSPADMEAERASFEEVVLVARTRAAILKLNPELPEEARVYALNQIIHTASLTDNVVENNRAVHRLLTEGVQVEILEDGHMRGFAVRVIDWENMANNDFVVANQFFVKGMSHDKIPDVVLFVNGLPLVVIELKNVVDENATVHKAFTQLTNYQSAVPELFVYNGLLVISDGLDARAGTITSGFDRFIAWKSVDGKKDSSRTIPEIQTLIQGMLKPSVLLDLVRNFTVYEDERKFDDQGLPFVHTVKKVAAYHQYYAVQKAVESTLRASDEAGDKRAGVVWHTQGSGKSLSMVFYAGKIVQRLNNPTIVMVTDRNDLDDQLFGTFAGAKELLRQDPVQAENREHLKELLKVSGGGIIFTTIQKFSLVEGENEYGELSDRRNIIVMADEAHRSQYGFNATVRESGDGASISYGFAKYLRDALPNASFIGFTGTPIERDDANTRTVFGEYVDVYDIQQAVEDHATVPISYESRLVKIRMNDDAKAELDFAVDAVLENEEGTVTEKAKAKWAQMEAIVGHRARVADIARDIVEHYSARQEVLIGKAMIVVMSRRIAVELYEEIVKIKPDWGSDNLKEGAIKVVMTATSSDPSSWQPHHTTKDERKDIATRFKDVKDSLKLVIVRDMWLTGFDVPCLHTMYIDKPMRGANLMQAIARVNRVYKDKQGGLIVDYIGIAGDLKEALAVYTESGGKGDMVTEQSVNVIPHMIAKHEVVRGILNSVSYVAYFTGTAQEKLGAILEVEDFLLGSLEKKERFLKEVVALSQLFALAMPNEKAIEIRDEVAFFHAVKARLVKLSSDGGGRDVDIETTIRQIVDKAVVSEGVIDIFDAAGIKKPDISILSEEFLEEIRGMKRQNIALELLKKILNGELGARGRKNAVQSKKFSEMLHGAIKKYQNNLLTAAQVIDELIKLAKDIKEADKRGESLGLSEDEIAFYDALTENESAEKILGDEKLKDLARILVGRVRENATIDWSVRESSRARMRVMVKRLLSQYGYPPDKQEVATDTVLKQAELLTSEIV